MINASSSEALLMFGKWRETASQLHVVFRLAGTVLGEFEATVEEAPPDTKNPLILSLVRTGQKSQWKFSLTECSLWYSAPSEEADLFPEFSKGGWQSCFAVGFLNCGLIALFLEAKE